MSHEQLFLMQWLAEQFGHVRQNLGQLHAELAALRERMSIQERKARGRIPAWGLALLNPRLIPYWVALVLIVLGEWSFADLKTMVLPHR